MDTCPTCYQELPPAMDLSLDLKSNALLWKGIKVQFRPKEAEVLSVLMDKADDCGWVSLDCLMNSVWANGDYPGDKTVSTYMCIIKRKIKDAQIPITIENGWLTNRRDNMERKIAAGGGIGLPLAVMIAWGWNVAMPDAQMPAEVSAAMGSFISTLVGYLGPNKT